MDADLQPFTRAAPETTPTGDAPVGGRFAANPRDSLLVSRSKLVGRNAVLDQAVERQAERFSIDPLLIYALVWQESGGRAGATSPKGASGVVQLMPATAARFGVQNPRHIPEAVRGGVEYLVWLLDRYDGNVSLALAGYNSGEGAVDAYLMGRTMRTRDGRIINPRAIRTPDGIPPYRETQNYVRGIAYRYRVLRAGYERELSRKM